MGKQKKKNKNRNVYREDYDDKKMCMESMSRDRHSNGGDKSIQKDKRTNDRAQEVTYKPMAIALRDIFASQIMDFQEQDPSNYKTAIQDLFNIGAWPAKLNVGICDDSDRYDLYQVDKDTRLNRDDPAKLNRLSTIVIAIDAETHVPAFMVQAYIAPTGVARVIVHEMGDNGPIYRNTLRWSNQDSDSK